MTTKQFQEFVIEFIQEQKEFNKMILQRLDKQEIFNEMILEKVDNIEKRLEKIESCPTIQKELNSK